MPLYRCLSKYENDRIRLTAGKFYNIPEALAEFIEADTGPTRRYLHRVEGEELATLEAKAAEIEASGVPVTLGSEPEQVDNSTRGRQ